MEEVVLSNLMFPSILRPYKWTQRLLRTMIDVETATHRVKYFISSNATRTLWWSLTIAWFHCLLQDSIVCKLASYMQIKNSPWALALCQLYPPSSKARLWVEISAWFHMERVVSALSSSGPTDLSRNSEHSVFKDCTSRRVSFCFGLCFILQ